MSWYGGGGGGYGGGGGKGKGKGKGKKGMPMGMWDEAAWMGMLKGLGKGWAWGMGKDGNMHVQWNAPAWSAPKFEVDDSGGVLGEFTGMIKSFSVKNGYGFIESDEIKQLGHKDVWMHADMKKELRVGTAVKFVAFLTGKNQLQCKDVEAVPLD
eukprot:TRINITY_DN3583_c0_g1_i1.p2 TRINITY_DN3583_c0_g1~~TRINITY_DN3583_c0_g1_i1.p2  ORF type:complete len:154 (-),score=53.23 TRINITY_DN3583_c0_g1_i1:41-502(-)